MLRQTSVSKFDVMYVRLQLSDCRLNELDRFKFGTALGMQLQRIKSKTIVHHDYGSEELDERFCEIDRAIHAWTPNVVQVTSQKDAKRFLDL